MPSATLAVITEPMSSGISIQPSSAEHQHGRKEVRDHRQRCPIRMPPWAIVMTIVIMAKSDRKLVNKIALQGPLDFVDQRHDAGDAAGDPGGGIDALPHRSGNPPADGRQHVGVVDVCQAHL